MAQPLKEKELSTPVPNLRWTVPRAWGAAAAAYSILTLGGFVDDRAAVWLTDLAWTAAAALAAFATHRAAQSLSGPPQLTWRLLTIACTSWLIGQLIWNWNELVRGVTVPFPSVADYFYTALGAFVIAAFCVLRPVQTAPVSTWGRLWNLALIICTFAAAYVAALFEPTLRSNHSAYFLGVAIMESLIISSAFVVAVYFLWSYRWGSMTTPLILIVAGVATQAAVDLLYIHDVIVGEFSAVSGLNVAWIIAFGFQYWAADEQLRLSRPSPGAAAKASTVEEAERVIEAVLPGALLLLILGALYAFRSELSPRVVMLTAVILSLFAVILATRGVWMYLEERRLTHELARQQEALERSRAEVQTTMHELRELQARLQLAASAGNVGLWAWDLHDNTVYYSTEWKRQLGYLEHEISDEFEEWRSRVHPDDLQRALDTVQAFLKQPWTDYELELRLRHRDGSYRWILAQAAIRTENGEPVSMLGSHVDVTKRKQIEEALRQSEARYRELAGELEQRVGRRTEELREAYRELESFAYAVAHDLKAPLRAMDGFSHLLLESSSDKLDEHERNHVHRIRRGALQMDALIEGLLAYSRMERREMTATRLDLPVLIEAILAERVEEIRDRGVQVKMQNLPQTIVADREGLGVILRNLLDNAFKFTREAAEPLIEIGAEIAPDRITLFVEDNGIGFDERYHDQIFLIFQRLHRGEQYRGTGIGLALARKAAQRMNGKLWARSAPGRGSTFFLELPTT